MEERSTAPKWLIITYAVIITVLFLLAISEGIGQYFKASNQSESAKLFKSGKEKANSKRYKEAIIDYDKAISLDIKNVEYYCERGIANYELKYFSNALKDFNRAIELDPNELKSLYTRALLKKDLKDYKGSIVDYTKLIKLFPNESDCYRDRAFIKNKINDFEGSSKDYVKADELETHYPSNYDD
ncbi:tetratricopeptide repeat protein [Flavobacterium sp. Arc3]|uniref:tetratricopeptide repeat protein n=1 Tax=Flavobacterium sp. Arc3 TaxID=3046686 RepID=UPI00352CD3BB